MRIFRWVLLIINVIFLMTYATTLVGYFGQSQVELLLQVIAALGVMVIFTLANSVFILITWRWCPEGKAASRIAGAFD